MYLQRIHEAIDSPRICTSSPISTSIDRSALVGTALQRISAIISQNPHNPPQISRSWNETCRASVRWLTCFTWRCTLVPLQRRLDCQDRLGEESFTAINDALGMRALIFLVSDLSPSFSVFFLLSNDSGLLTKHIQWVYQKKC